MRNPLDWHGLNAQHWNCSLKLAEKIAFGWVYSTVGVNDLHPTFLDICHPDIRASFLANRGIILGDN